MAQRKTPFAIGEWYHCYNRGIENILTFKDTRDYYRFLELLYLANDPAPLRREDIGTLRFDELLTLPRSGQLVAIGAFCLMPNHFHLVLKEIEENGISTFMLKLGTSYTLYFNARHARRGNLFYKPFRSRHVSSDRYFQHLISYVHSNPAALYEPEWKKRHIVDPQFLGERIAVYPYSSLGAFTGARAPMRAILDAEVFSVARTVPPQKMLEEALKYNADADIP